ncbi:MAG TPA: hypothetical protein VN646_16935 [Candidatus Acidoferrum sp.]|nr:hypothetical protein [Candidatus Acidoferrum sp.]
MRIAVKNAEGVQRLELEEAEPARLVARISDDAVVEVPLDEAELRGLHAALALMLEMRKRKGGGDVHAG